MNALASPVLDAARAQSSAVTSDAARSATGSVLTWTSGVASASADVYMLYYTPSASGQLHRGWLGAAFERLAHLRSLPRGWDSYDGQPVSVNAGASALTLLRFFNSAMQSAPAMSATPDGGIVFEWSRQGLSVSIEATESGELVVDYENETEGVEWSERLVHVPDLRALLWRVSEVS